jgi:hypothetical protein
MILATNIPLKAFGDVAKWWFLESDYHVSEMYSDVSFPFDVGESFRISRNFVRIGVHDMLDKTFRR